MRVSEYICNFLYENGVRHVFAIGGAGSLPILSAIRRDNRIKIICCHHEQACSMAAFSYSAFNREGRIGVCITTTGPGATNAITGLCSAWVDSIPVIFISGQVNYKDSIYYKPNLKLRQNGIQEVNISAMVYPSSKGSFFVKGSKEIDKTLKDSFKLILKGRKGPIWIDICADVFNIEYVS